MLGMRTGGLAGRAEWRCEERGVRGLLYEVLLCVKSIGSCTAEQEEEEAVASSARVP